MHNRVATQTMGALPLRKLALRFALSLAIAAVFCALLYQRIGQIDMGLIATELATLSTPAWAAAFCATIISFWAIGQYDVTIHRHLATGVAAPAARRAGIAAIAVSQTVGAGLITGALLRWRCLNGVNLWQATLLSGAVAVSFLCGWAVLTSVVLLISGPSSLAPVATGILMLGAGAALVAAMQPARLRWLRLPNLLTIGRVLLLTAIDTLFAALALWFLLPFDLAFATLLPAFLLAFGAGLVSGTPGGVGAFEVTLLALVPQVPDAPLLAAVLGWRVVYFALPAVCGAALAARGRPVPTPQPAAPVAHPENAVQADVLICAAPRAEYGLARQGHLAFCGGADGAWLVGRTPHTLTALFDPLGTATFAALKQQATAEARVPAIYKASPRTAARARACGWQVAALGAEASLSPQTFQTDGPARAALRRKLRKSLAAGVQIDLLAPHGCAELAAIARLWGKQRRERGFSMGQFDAAYVALQRVYVARVAGRITAFITLHPGRCEWTLDLMRQSPAAPDGTMHHLIVHAISDARAAGIARLSLAAAGAPRALPSWLRGRADKAALGLVQFKQSFAPDWTPDYLCAPSRAALAIAAGELAIAIHWPGPLHPQDHHAQYGFAPVPRPWQRRATFKP